MGNRITSASMKIDIVQEAQSDALRRSREPDWALKIASCSTALEIYFFRLKFKTNWKPDQTEYETCKKRHKHDRISAFLHSTQQASTKLPLRRLLVVTFRSPQTHMKQTKHSQASNLVCLDPQKHKTYRKPGREMKKKCFSAILMQFEFCCFSLSSLPRKIFHLNYFLVSCYGLFCE